MQALTVAERELRVAARRRATYLSRLLVSGIAVIIAGITLWVVTFFGVTPIPGSGLFEVLRWVAFVGACLVGMSLTADSISEEKREGTLGLLFLTPLQGWSITLGKLAGHGLPSFYAVMAMIPVLAMPLMIGGSNLVSFVKSVLIILETLVMSLAAGLFASSVCRRGWAASALALILLLLLTIGLPVLNEADKEFFHTGRIDWLLFFSPAYAFLLADWPGGGQVAQWFWVAAGAQAALIAALLGATCKIVPRSWRDGSSGRRIGRILDWWNFLRYGSGSQRAQLRARLLNRNPILWLGARDQWGYFGFPLLFCAAGIAVTLIGKRLKVDNGPFNEYFCPVFGWAWAMPIFYVIFCFRLAVAAAEAFAADRKSGALELILATPLSVAAILRGRWLSIFRRFWGSAAALLLAHAFVLWYVLNAFAIDPGVRLNLFKVARDAARHVLGAATIEPDLIPAYIIPIVLAAAGFLIVILWLALGWTGMFMAMRTRKQMIAPWAALIVLSVPPAGAFIAFVAIIVWREWVLSDQFLQILWVGAAGFCFVLLNALFWMFFSRAWLLRRFRAAASDRWQQTGLRKFFRLV